MNDSIVWQTVLAIITSLGGGGLIVFGLSSWLGKFWAERLMAREAAQHSKDLELLRSSLFKENDIHSHIFREKIELYKEAGLPLIDFITEFQSDGRLSEESRIQFEKSRLASTALLAMFAPIEVFNAYNDLIDYLFDCSEQKQEWSFPQFRIKALLMLSLMRQDVGLFSDDVTYSGKR